MKSILIIDDELEIGESLKMILEYEDYYVEYCSDSQTGLDKIATYSYDLLLLDIQMPGLNGFEVLNMLREKKIELNVIMISAFNSIENAIKATKLGAFDFIEKPIDREKLLISVRNAIEKSSLIKENRTLKKSAESKDIIIGKSKAIKSILETVDRVAKTEARVLITGENGTGKELIARAIHKASNRANKEIIEVNCAAIPNELIESELFGHEKGSFTGAVQQRIGKFEQADGGTLFLDEIGDMSQQAQAKVLRAIEDGKIERVGGTNKISVDVRIVAATNKDLKEEIKNGNFREDLYHRLNVIPIIIPPLRERKEDIPELINHFISDICTKNNIPSKEIGNDALLTLQKFSWTGNIRELKNFTERLLIMIPGNKITEDDIYKLMPPLEGKIDDILNVSNSFQEFKEKAERVFIKKQLELNDWNISKTADILEIQRSHLYSKMKKYDIEKGKD
ncbi:MAG: sigma-54-dependent Fis family transcriptional regulator [Ignavibacteria bacterium]|nr:sigma-54-dependent Fis family transcriptional regulator [Ignavibacteria bacterium]